MEAVVRAAGWLRLAALVSPLRLAGEPAGSTCYIRAGALFDPRSGEVLHDRVITVSGDRITGVSGAAGHQKGGIIYKRQ